jgi:hypothetical protein
VSEADTVTLIKDILSDIFGYDKYNELTSEQQIRGTFCDLAVKIDGKIHLLIEVKSAGTDLNDAHLRQAINYGVNQGIEWVVLTNGIDWRLYRLRFVQPVEADQIAAFNLLQINPKNEEHLQRLFLLCREGVAANAKDTFHQHTLLLNRYTVGQILKSEPVIAVIRRELRRLFPDLKVDLETISDLVENDIVKRDVFEGDKVAEAQARIKKASQKLAREAKKAAGANQANANGDGPNNVEP